jgi:CzcA family heavy metal efflux pump
MMRWVVSSSLRFRYLVVAAAVAMVFFGSSRLTDQPVDVFPEFAPPRVEVQTLSLGLSAAEVEALVTIPLEQSLNGLPGLDVMRSKSVSQLSSIEIIFDRGTDLLLARQLVTERIASVTPTLPTWAAPPFVMPPLSATSRVMKIGLSSEDVSLIDMSSLAYWSIRARLLRVPGVANVAIWGERLEQYHLEVQPERLRANQVSLNQVMQVTADSLDAGILRFSDGAVIGTGGFIDTPNQRFSIQHNFPVLTTGDLAAVSFTNRAGNPLQLGDIANVTINHQPLLGDAIIDDGPGLMLIVEKFPWANTLDVTRGVEDAMAEMGPGLPGIKVDTTIFRPATFIESSIDNLTRALILGSILVFALLMLFLFEWRTALISLIAIPLSLVAAGLILNLLGATVNTMILAGLVIAIGVVVDDAIIDIENIVRRLRQHRLEGSRVSTTSIILTASLEVRSAIIYATLIDVAALLPVFLMTGLSGAFFQPLALAYGLAVLASMVVALTVTPALGLILLGNAPIERGRSPVILPLQRAYEAALVRIIRSPKATMAGVATIVLLGLAVLPQMGQSLLPDFKERDFLMHWLTKPGTSQPEMARITTLASEELRSIPGVRNFGAHIGQAFLADEVVGVDFGENWISIEPSVNYDETLASIQHVVSGYPGLYTDVQTYLKERIREVLAGSHEAITIRVFGQDLVTLRAKAQEIKEAMAGIEGITDLHVELQVDIPQVQVEVDLEAAQRHDVKPGDVRRAAAALVASEEVGDIFAGGRAYDVHIIGEPSTRNSVEAIKELLIDTSRGGYVRLGDVADVRIAATPNSIRRQDSSRRIDVGGNVTGRDLGSAVDDVEAAIKKLEFPLEYHYELVGEYQERRAAQTRMFGYAIAAAIAVFLLLQAAFGSWRLGTLSFLTLPSALVGGLLAAYLGGGVISLGSLVGFFTVLGIAARNGIMLINHYQHLERFEGEAFGPNLVLRGARERLAPILMTALATALALVPLAIAGDKPGHEIEHPMAIVILGGLVTSTSLNLFIVPSLYLRFGGTKAPPTQPV